MRKFFMGATLALLLFPVFVFAQAEPDVGDEGVPSPDKVQEEGWTLVPKGCTGPNATNPDECGFDEFIQLIANAMGLLMAIALSLSTLLFSIAGFRYVTAAGNTGQIESAKKIFFNVAIGLAIVFGAYLIVQVVVSVLGVEGGLFNQFLEN